MTLPTVLVLAFLTVYPFGYTIYYSLTNFNMLKPKLTKFIGFDNYIKIVQDPYFIQALSNTLRFMALAVILETLLGLLVAVLVTSFSIKQQKLFRILILLPMILPPVTVALIWRIMLSNNYGIINKLLEALGWAPVNWLNDIRTAFLSILIIDIWQYMPFAFLLIYASLQAVSRSQYEAAQIDGANGFQQFLYITLPNISGGILLVILLRAIDSFRLFDKVNILTRGGPANSTATITQYIYNFGVNNFRIGYSSAGAIIMTLIVLVIAAFYLRNTLKQQS